jgi:RNA polymerase sigma-70 factor (ECF subfamily)
MSMQTAISVVTPEPATRLPQQQSLADANAQLVDLARRDVEAGLVLLHQRYARMVGRLVWRLLGPDPDQEDIVQQVFFTILRSITNVREPEKLDAWVRTVTVNTVRQELRKRSVRRAFFSYQPKADPAGDMVRELESRDLLASCVGILDKMAPNLRVVFVLHFVEGFSQKEVADICGCALITVKRRVKAADKRFRQLVAHNPELLRLMEARS